MDFQYFFEQAMDRVLPKIEGRGTKLALNLGAGYKGIFRTVPLDLPDWDADAHDIPYPDNSVSCIYAYHFLEHVRDPVYLLFDCQRVLIKGGCMNICVPYYSSSMQAQDLDHKNSFCENTWITLFKNKYYNKNKIEWKFKIGFNLICGIDGRNLCLLTQLIKTKE